MSKSKKVKNNAPIRKKRHILSNFLDVAIILLLIATIVITVLRGVNIESISKLWQKDTDVKISFTIKNINEKTQHFFSIGDRVYVKDSEEFIGHIGASSENSDKPLTTKPASKILYEQNNAPIVVTYPTGTMIDADGVLLAKGTFTKDATDPANRFFKLNGSTYISAGQTLTLCTEKVTFEITITSIEENQE